VAIRDDTYVLFGPKLLEAAIILLAEIYNRGVKPKDRLTYVEILQIIKGVADTLPDYDWMTHE